MIKPALDLRCYFVTGQGPDVVERARQAAAGSAGVQLVFSPVLVGSGLAAALADCGAAVARRRIRDGGRLGLGVALAQQGLVELGILDRISHGCQPMRFRGPGGAGCARRFADLLVARKRN